MDDKNILTKSKKRKSYLNKIVATKINKIPEGTAVNVDQETKYKILNNSVESIVIEVNTKTFIKPEALFSIEIEHVIELIPTEEITDAEINSNIEEITAHLGAEVSYIIASITKEMIGSHMILPPVLTLSKADS